MKNIALTATEKIRYAQQTKLDVVGQAGQEKLKNARVLCVGLGGLGSPLLLYLAAAGVGTLGLVDNDSVDASNLQRQLIYKNKQIGFKKVHAAKKQLFSLNPHITLNLYEKNLTLQNATEIISSYDVVADCSDNFYTRYLINDICFYLDKPYIFASVHQFQGHCATFLGKNSACFRCLFPDSQGINAILNCEEAGVMGVSPGLLGVIQATEIIKWILKAGDLLTNHLLTVNLLTMDFQKFNFEKNPDCPLCTHHQSYESLVRTTLCNSYAISITELNNYLKQKRKIQLIDVRTKEEHLAYNIGGLSIPLDELPSRLNEIDPNAEIIVYCKTGNRSQQAVKILMGAQFKAVKYLEPLYPTDVKMRDFNAQIARS